ncbi:thiamine-phosphate kinase [Granulibacter bethesdensis]|uniref:thiamine-phosphate kinase n=1 Tax=Granulibacter bethesdensis TaxID=364410 RepID=UPI00090A24E6|nr:thiamine-phosphate kinase [Granulibacter bethesdensis]APH59336.1 Thiamine-monophosphate kinase [Granulibacter bethesdensis]
MTAPPPSFYGSPPDNGEFGMIARYLAPLAAAGGLNLTDDAALLPPPPGLSLVLAADAMVEGVHYLPGTDPHLLARKLLRVNLSDLAAMGAAPLHYLMTLALPRGTDPAPWFTAFTAGLAEDQAMFGITLLGGDTTSIKGPACLSLTVIGTVEPGKAVRRQGACPDDEIWVTGTIGDGALGLLALTEGLADPDDFLAGRYHLPSPRLGLIDQSLVQAAADISDGLLQDLGHLCTASGLDALIEADTIPLSNAARQHMPEYLPLCLSGGDDYELVMAVSPSCTVPLRQRADSLGIPVQRIGQFHARSGQKPGVHVLASDGSVMPFERKGWQHF